MFELLTCAESTAQDCQCNECCQPFIKVPVGPTVEATLGVVGLLAAAGLGLWLFGVVRRRRLTLRDVALLKQYGVELKAARVQLVAEKELRELHAEVEGRAVGPSVRSTFGADLRFAIAPDELVVGPAEDAARGINWYLRADDGEVYERLAHGVASLRREFADHGTAEDKECLDYILNAPAGSSDKAFPNGVRDRGRHGETLADFVSHPHSVKSGLTLAHVLALRLYTSAAYKSINAPLRDRGRQAPHPFPVTVNLIAEGLKRLRTVAADLPGAHETLSLWRGMRNLRVGDAFTTEGGTEIAPMSATTDLSVALRYAISPHSLLFMITTKSFMERGVDLSYLSCFPEEREFLFAPLTYLRPTGATQFVESGDMTVTVVEVTPFG